MILFKVVSIGFLYSFSLAFNSKKVLSDFGGANEGATLNEEELFTLEFDPISCPSDEIECKNIIPQKKMCNVFLKPIVLLFAKLIYLSEGMC
jgi:hypothetical protein